MQLTTLGEALKFAERSFKAAHLHFGHGTDNAWDEAVSIALFVLQLPKEVDADIQKRILTEEEKKAFLSLIERRIKERKPVPYLIHEAWFAGLKLYVDERVIIPRSPFAELIKKKFQPWIGKNPIHRILDLCTGSGCMAIACAKEFPLAQIDAVDISEEALEVAQKNIDLYHYHNQITLIKSNLFQGCHSKRYDLIISNPPYVDAKEMASLPKEYHWEPKLALASGPDGLDLVKQILAKAHSYLTDKGLLFVEVGHSEPALKQQYPKTPFIWLKFKQGGQGVFLLKAEDKTCW